MKLSPWVYRLVWLSACVLFPLMALMGYVIIGLERDIIFAFFAFTVMAFGLAAGQALYFVPVNRSYAATWFVTTLIGFGLALPVVIMMGFVVGFFYLLALGALFNGLLAPFGLEGIAGQALVIAAFLPLPAGVGAGGGLLLALVQAMRNTKFGVEINFNRWLKRNAVAGAVGGASFMLLIFLLVGLEIGNVPGLWLALGLPLVVGLPLGLLTMSEVETMRGQLENPGEAAEG
jgi:hypothetical protein